MLLTHRRPEPIYAVGDKVSIDTANFRHEYKTSTSRSAKLMPQWEGPFTVVKAFPKQSLYELNIPLTTPQATVRRHASKLKPYQESDLYHQNAAPRILDRPPAPEPPRIIQVLDEKTKWPRPPHPLVQQVKVRLAGDGVKSKWISLDKAETYMGWREAWEEFMGKDELYLDKLMVETADWFELLDGVVE